MPAPAGTVRLADGHPAVAFLRRLTPDGLTLTAAYAWQAPSSPPAAATASAAAAGSGAMAPEAARLAAVWTRHDPPLPVDRDASASRRSEKALATATPVAEELRPVVETVTAQALNGVVEPWIFESLGTPLDLPEHVHTDRLHAYSSLRAPEAGSEVETALATTTSVMRLDGVPIWLVVTAPAGELAWTRRASRAWAAVTLGTEVALTAPEWFNAINPETRVFVAAVRDAGAGTMEFLVTYWGLACQPALYAILPAGAAATRQAAGGLVLRFAADQTVTGRAFPKGPAWSGTARRYQLVAPGAMDRVIDLLGGTGGFQWYAQASQAPLADFALDGAAAAIANARTACAIAMGH